MATRSSDGELTRRRAAALPGISPQRLVVPGRRPGASVAAGAVVAVAVVVAVVLLVVAPVVAGVAIAVVIVAAAVGYGWWTLVPYRPALLVDGEGLHVGGRTVRWADVAEVSSSPEAVVVATHNGQPLACAAEALTCPPAEVERLVRVWAGTYCVPVQAAAPTVDAAGRGVSDEQWRAAEAAQAPDAAWRAYGDRDDEDPLHR
jgi:hypothetical protein